MVAQAGGLFSDDGELTDEETHTRLQRFLAGFAAHFEQARGERPS